MKTWPSITKTLTSFLPWIKDILQQVIASMPGLMVAVCGFHPNPWKSASDMQVDGVLSKAINQNLREYWNYKWADYLQYSLTVPFSGHTWLKSRRVKLP